jgi:hypothetical protein
MPWRQLPDTAQPANEVVAMSLIRPIDMRGRAGLREAVEAIIAGKVDRIEWTDSLNLRITRDSDSAEIKITDGKAEVALRGLPDPDFISAKLYPDHAIVSLTITNVRVDY